MDETWMTCHKCGNSLTENKVVCPACGTKLDAGVLPSFEIPGYSIIGTLGHGGMGTVYLAEDNVLERRVAIKVISERLVEDQNIHDRFLREARVWATIEHPNVVRVYSLNHYNDRLYLIMEYVDGQTLDKLLEHTGALAPVEAIRISKQCVEALSAACEKGIVHRDIKPSNIMIDQNNHVRVVDFGLAKKIDIKTQSSLTHTGLILGTPYYIAPEQARGEHVDFRCDIYSLGIVLYEMLTGQPPFQGSSPLKVIEKHLSEPLPPLKNTTSGWPDDLINLVEWMTQKNRDHRPVSFQELHEKHDLILQHFTSISSPDSADTMKPFPFTGLSTSRQAEPQPLGITTAGTIDSLLRSLDDKYNRKVVNFFISGRHDESDLSNLISTFINRSEDVVHNLIIGRSQCRDNMAPEAPFQHLLLQLTGGLEQDLAAGSLSTEIAGRLWNYIPVVCQTLASHAPALIGNFLSARDLFQRVQSAATENAEWPQLIRNLVDHASNEEGEIYSQTPEICSHLVSFFAHLSHKNNIVLIFENLHHASHNTISLLVTFATELRQFLKLEPAQDRSRILIIGTFVSEGLPEDKQKRLHHYVRIFNELQEQNYAMIIEGGTPSLPYLLNEMKTKHATELHLASGVPPKFRIRRKLLPGDYLHLTHDQVKELCMVALTDDQKEKLEKHQELTFSFGVKSINFSRFRTHLFKQRGSYGAVIHYLPYAPKTFTELGLPRMLKNCLTRDGGLLLVSGPHGSGTTTSLASLVDEINMNEQKLIITIEDPIEFILRSKNSTIIQQEISTDTPSPIHALHRIDRLHPDVLMIELTCNQDMVQRILQLSEIGVLCLGSIKAPSVELTLLTLMESFPKSEHDDVRYRLANTLKAILCQDLVPDNRGGMSLVFEVLVVTPEGKQLIKENKIDQLYELIKTNTDKGMMTKEQSLYHLYEQGILSHHNCLSTCNIPEEFLQLLS